MAAETTTARRWGTLADLADELRCSVRTGRRMIARGDIYAERVGPRMIRVDLDSIQGRPLTISKADR